MIMERLTSSTGAVESNGTYVGTNLNIIRDADGNVSDIQLTDKQQETLDNALEEFILAYSNQAQERCEPYKDFIKELNIIKIILIILLLMLF